MSYGRYTSPFLTAFNDAGPQRKTPETDELNQSHEEYNFEAKALTFEKRSYHIFWRELRAWRGGSEPEIYIKSSSQHSLKSALRTSPTVVPPIG